MSYCPVLSTSMGNSRLKYIVCKHFCNIDKTDLGDKWVERTFFAENNESLDVGQFIKILSFNQTLKE